MPRRPYSLIWIVLLTTVAAGCQTQQATLKGPDYTCHVASGAIKIDGKLDEPAWAKADKITKFHPLQPKDADYLSPTIVRMLWDERCLYVAFECTDDDIWSYSDKPDDELWNGDVGELLGTSPELRGGSAVHDGGRSGLATLVELCRGC